MNLSVKNLITYEKFINEKIRLEPGFDDFLDWLSEKLGIQIGTFLDSGDYGAVFEIDRYRVIKIDSLSKNAITAQYLINKNLPGLTRIYSVGKILVPGRFQKFTLFSRWQDDKGILYYIIMERVKIPKKSVHDEIDRIRYVYYKNFQDTFDFVSLDIHKFDTGFDMLETAIAGPAYISYLDDRVSSKTAEMAKGIATIFDSLQKLEISFIDFHAEQLGYNNRKELVAFDITELEEVAYRRRERIKNIIKESKIV